MHRSRIEWTGSTWNPVTGCTKVSAGCANCYAERMAKRLQAMGQPNYARGFEVACHPRTLELPLSWKKPQTVFVNSMSDLFHDEVPDRFVAQVFEVMNQASHHCFQVLTKRADRMVRLASRLEWTPNIWMGVTVEDNRYLDRLDALRNVPAAVRFLSLEPLLGPVPDLRLEGLHWVIVGGESGPGARPMRAEWATAVRDLCLDAKTPFFFKQWGGVRKKAAGRKLQGRLWNQMPKRDSARNAPARNAAGARTPAPPEAATKSS